MLLSENRFEQPESLVNRAKWSVMEPFCRRLHSCLQPQQIGAQSVLNYWNNPWKDLPNKPLYFNKLRARARCHSTAGSWRFVKLVFGNQPMILIQVDHVLCATLSTDSLMPTNLHQRFDVGAICRIVVIAWAANSPNNGLRFQHK